MKQPEGFTEQNQDWMYKLMKGIYRLKQSGRLWYKKLASTLVDMGFKILKRDSSVYVLTNDVMKVFLSVFVDDCTLVSKVETSLEVYAQRSWPY